MGSELSLGIAFLGQTGQDGAMGEVQEGDRSAGEEEWEAGAGCQKTWAAPEPAWF